MKLIVNGEEKQIHDVKTIRELVVQLGLGKQAVAVELNRQLIPRKAHESTAVSDGDVLEIVTLVGGG